jgi:hypothetical protein
MLVVYVLVSHFVFERVTAQTLSQQPANPLVPKRSNSALFIDDNSVTAAAISTRNIKISEQIITVTGAGKVELSVLCQLFQQRLKPLPCQVSLLGTLVVPYAYALPGSAVIQHLPCSSTISCCIGIASQGSSYAGGSTSPSAE